MNPVVCQINIESALAWTEIVSFVEYWWKT